MSTEIKASFEVTNWDEHQFDVHAGAAKLTRANVTKSYSGAIMGESVTQWLMAYADNGSASFVGVERITATIDRRRGALVLRHVGAFENGAAKATLTVLTGSCSGELAATTGAGEFIADPSGRVRLDLSFA